MKRVLKDLDWLISSATECIGKDFEFDSKRGLISQIVIVTSEKTRTVYFVLQNILEFTPGGWKLLTAEISASSWVNPVIESINDGNILIHDRNKNGQVEFGSIQITQANAIPN